MKTDNENPESKREANKDDATKPSTNIEKDYAHEINRGDAKSKTYKEEGSTEPQGPNYDKKSKSADGSTSAASGVFK